MKQCFLFDMPLICHSELMERNAYVFGIEALRNAAIELGHVTGRIDTEDVLDAIFRDFCIGK